MTPAMVPMFYDDVIITFVLSGRYYKDEKFLAKIIKS